MVYLSFADLLATCLDALMAVAEVQSIDSTTTVMAGLLSSLKYVSYYVS